MFSNKWLEFLAVISIAVLAGCSGSLPTDTPIPTPFVANPTSPASIIEPSPESPTNQEQIGLPNPASVFCEEQGGVLEIRTDNTGGQYGVCKFANGTECDEWEFFRGECQPEGNITTPPTPEPDKNIYTNATYGFSISFPAPWVVEEHSDYLLLSKPGYRIFLGFQSADEEPKPFRTGMPEGDFIDGGNATLLGQSIPKKILVFEGKNKVVAYGGRVQAGDLILVMYLDAVETPDLSYREIHIPPEIIVEADEIIASITLKSGEQPKLKFNP